MFKRSPENPTFARRGKAFIATLIGCCALVAFGMLRQVELSNDQLIAIAVLCVAAVVTALAGEYAAERSRINARQRARQRKLAKADESAKKALDAAAAAGVQPPPGTSFGSSAKSREQPKVAPEVQPPERQPEPTLKLPDAAPKPRGNQRKFGRLPLELLWCNLGKVVDLSAGGMKVLCDENRSGPVEIVLNDSGEILTIDGAIVWAKRHDARRWELGVEFSDLTPEDRRRLTHLATTFRQRRTMCA